MVFRSRPVSYLFGLMDHLALHKMVEGVVAAGMRVAATNTGSRSKGFIS